MAADREIKRRIRSVKNVRQITKALESVAAGRVRRAQQMVEATRPYSARARELLASVANLAGGETRRRCMRDGRGRHEPHAPSGRLRQLRDRGQRCPIGQRVHRVVEDARAAAPRAGRRGSPR